MTPRRYPKESFPHGFRDAVDHACERPTLEAALLEIVVWEHERAAPGKPTCFAYCMAAVRKDYVREDEPLAESADWLEGALELTRVILQGLTPEQKAAVELDAVFSAARLAEGRDDES